jgi:steroid delta-isomerase-like uncharacterized protein
VAEGATPDKLKVAELRAFGERYMNAWNSHDADELAACCHEEIVWEDPVLPAPVRGPAAVADFLRDGVATFSDLAFEETGEPAISTDKTTAYVPWRMMGTNDGPLDPPGFPPTGRYIDINGVDVWRFRDGKLWRYRAVYDFNELARQLGLLPAPGSMPERVMVKAAQLRAKLPV